jgi:ribosome-binding protein aMBF1 (putative translation factor)
MTVAVSQAVEKCTSSEGQRQQVSIVVEGFFALILKGAQRLLGMPQERMRVLKRLAVEFGTSPQSERLEIVETMMELILPDETIGNVGDSPPAEDPQLRARVTKMRQIIGSQIRKHREALGWTQADLATKAKIRQSHVSRLERGKLAPTRKTIERLAKALRVNPTEIDYGYREIPGLGSLES